MDQVDGKTKAIETAPRSAQDSIIFSQMELQIPGSGPKPGKNKEFLVPQASVPNLGAKPRPNRSRTTALRPPARVLLVFVNDSDNLQRN